MHARGNKERGTQPGAVGAAEPGRAPHLRVVVAFQGVWVASSQQGRSQGEGGGTRCDAGEVQIFETEDRKEKDPSAARRDVLHGV